ncbi:MAG: hypothetical protein GW949_07670 [Spirochaetales bacterium]|nr:hypothetical protein [Spirochaetales bacterium]
MDNDREVNALVTKSTSAFLQELGREFKERQKRYNLDEEFAKTRKNRSVFIPVTVLAVTVVLIGAAFFTATWIQSQSANVDVGIESAFSDVNLRDVLDTVKRNETEMEQARTLLRELLESRDRRIQSVESNAQRDLQLLGSRNLSVAARNQEAQIIENRLQTDLSGIQAEFDPQIAEVEARIAEIQARIDQYDARQLEQAREQQELINNQQRLFDLEKQQLTASHTAELEALRQAHAQEVQSLEAFQVQLEQNLTQRYEGELRAAFNRYNPQFTEAGLGPLLSSAPRAGQGPPITQGPEVLGVTANDSVALSTNESLRGLYTDLETILDRLEAVPYENSVPQALSALRVLVLDSLETHRESQERLLAEVRSRDTQISSTSQQIEAARTAADAQAAQAQAYENLLGQIEYAIQTEARRQGDSGYLLDPRNTNEILVFTTDPELLDLGTEGLVFREDSRLIGRVSVTQVGPPTLAALVSLEEGEALAPYDSLIFNFQAQSGVPQGE